MQAALLCADWMTQNQITAESNDSNPLATITATPQLSPHGCCGRGRCSALRFVYGKTCTSSKAAKYREIELHGRHVSGTKIQYYQADVGKNAILTRLSALISNQRVPNCCSGFMLSDRAPTEEQRGGRWGGGRATLL